MTIIDEYNLNFNNKKNRLIYILIDKSIYITI